MHYDKNTIYTKGVGFDGVGVVDLLEISCSSISFVGCVASVCVSPMIPKREIKMKDLEERKGVSSQNTKEHSVSSEALSYSSIIRFYRIISCATLFIMVIRSCLKE